VLYDALVDVKMLKLARRAQRFFVGKRAGRHALSQSEIHAVMIRAARRGRYVVRLKGGDPFVFGRGGEEAQALQAAGIPFDIVPGVTTAVAAPALAGIPVTHRSLSSAFLVVSGHDEELFGRVIAELSAERLTLVVMMGLGRRAALATMLIERGWPLATPAAIIADASLPHQQAWRGPLGEVSAGRAVIDGDGPATLVIGDTAALTLTTAQTARRTEHEERRTAEK
jgi:uroporphyrin-III C-methyltransferase/precorrin-2 dehydrogenase/sirohydrochlorin ferrochelatase